MFYVYHRSIANLLSPETRKEIISNQDGRPWPWSHSVTGIRWVFVQNWPVGLAFDTPTLITYNPRIFPVEIRPSPISLTSRHQVSSAEAMASRALIY